MFPVFIEAYDRFGLITVQIDRTAGGQRLLLAEHLTPDIGRLPTDLRVCDEPRPQFLQIDAECAEVVVALDAA